MMCFGTCSLSVLIVIEFVLTQSIIRVSLIVKHQETKKNITSTSTTSSNKDFGSVFIGKSVLPGDSNKDSEIDSSKSSSNSVYYISLLILCYYYKYIIKTRTGDKHTALHSNKDRLKRISQNNNNMSVDMGDETQSVFISSNIFSTERKDNVDNVDNVNNVDNEKKIIEVENDASQKRGANITSKATTITTVPPARSAVRNIDILLQLFRTLAGKDKLAKITKYVLDLVKLVLMKKSKGSVTTSGITHKTQTALSTLLHRYSWNSLQISKIPLIDILNTLSVNIGIYRQCLRFGWSVFNFEKIIVRLKELVGKPGEKRCNAITIGPVKPLNEDDLVLFVEFYYNVVDELLLLRKLKVWDNATVYKKLAKHEALSWYYDIILSIKANLIKYHKIKTQILEMNIKLELKERCLQNLQLSSSLRDQMLQDIGSTVQIEQEISELVKDLNLVKLDLFRLFWDFLADTTDVFDMKTPPGTYAVLSLFSGITGFVKLWVNEKRKTSLS